MTELLNVTVWINPDKPKALNGYMDVLKFLKTHPQVTDDDKMTIYLLDLNSRCSNNLVNIYFGLSKMKDTSKIKISMTELLRILVNKIVPKTVDFTLMEQDNKVTLVIQEIEEDDKSPLPETSVVPQTSPEPKEEETMDDTVERIMNFSVTSNMSTRINTGTPSAPIRQVQAGTVASVASSVTVSAKKGLSTSSVHTLQSHSKKRYIFETEANPVTPNPKIGGITVTNIINAKIPEET